jgi:uncharacterized protein YecE (DUF72 family)
VNSTFYRPPAAATTRKWVQRTPPGFEFSLKLHQKLTHPRMHGKSSGGDDAGKPGAGELVSPVPSVDTADVDTVREGIDPVASAGRLGALLAQFPPSFKDTPRAREYLGWLLSALRDYPVAVELRHRSWSDALGGTLALLNEFSAAWVQIDEPKFRFSIRQNYLPNVSGFYYMRLHGRNVAKWWAHERSEDRYDYLYSEKELEPFSETAKAVKALVRKMYLYMNNHFAAKSVANALVLKRQLDVPVTGDYTPELLERYPFLEGIAPVATTAPLLP